jgi:hypothetical protein
MRQDVSLSAKRSFVQMNGLLAAEFGLALLCVTAAVARGEEKIFYGSRVGMTVTVVSASGLDTEHAVIAVKHTRNDAVAFCRDYVGKVTARCVRDELKAPLKSTISANCSTGEFTNFYGYRFRFDGPSRAKDAMAKYRIIDVATGEVADGSSASGYSVNLGIFRALCPKRAPTDE